MEVPTTIETTSVFKSGTENTSVSKLGKNICVGCNDFFFPNGDIYSGFFKASKDKKIVREGIGVYKTADGHSYDGPWMEDVLDGEDALLTYSDGSCYNGTVKNMRYEGNGRYTFPDGTYINGLFSKNSVIEGKKSPTNLKFIDKAGNKWIGKINPKNITMLPVHHFIPKEWKVQLNQYPITTESELLGVPLKTAKPKIYYSANLLENMPMML